METVTGAGEHPLLNHVVLQILFDRPMELRDMAAYRQVCVAWREACNKQWRSVFPIRLGSCSNDNPPADDAEPGYDVTPVERVRGVLGWPIDDFLRTFQDPDGHYSTDGYRNFVLSGIHLESTPCLHLSNEEQREGQEVDRSPGNFWDVVGPLAKSIKFESCVFQGDRPDIFERTLLEKLPNIEKLRLINSITVPELSHIVDRRICNDVRRGYPNLTRHQNLRVIEITGLPPPMCLFMLMIISPNVEVLKLDDDLKTRPVHHFLTFCAMVGLVKTNLDGTPFPLKHLDVMNMQFFDFQLNIRRHWETLAFSLETLAAFFVTPCVVGEDEDRHWLNEKAEHFANVWLPTFRHNARTLKILKLFRPPFFQVPTETPFQFRMAALQELHLYGNTIRDFSFVHRMPNLQVLCVDFKCHSNLDGVKKCFAASMSKKRISEVYKPLEETEFDCENGWQGRMEALRHIHWNSTLVPSSVEKIREFMPNLKILETVLSQDGFRAVCQHLPNMEELVLLFGSQVDDHSLTGVGLDSEERNPNNITALTGLKKFQLKKSCSSDGLGDKSVYEGFLKMTNLKSVQFPAGLTMSEAAIYTLKGHVAEVKVIRRHVPDAFGDAEECCRLHNFTELIRN